MHRKEAHLPVYLFDATDRHRLNGFIVHKHGSNFVYTVAHAIEEKKRVLRKHDGDIGDSSLLYVQFTKGGLRPVRFSRLDGTDDIVLSKLMRKRESGLVIQAQADCGDQLHLIGHFNNQRFVTEVIVDQIVGRELEIYSAHRDDYFFAGMSGAALVRDPEKEHHAVAMFNSVVGPIHIPVGRTGFAELLK